MASIQTIELRDEMFENVRHGIKTATLRNGKREISLGKTILYGNKNCVFIEVVQVNYKLLKEITDEDAYEEGYNSKDDLIKVMKDIYKDITEDSIVTQIYFNYLYTPNV